MTTFARDLTSLVFVDFYHKSNEAVFKGSLHAIRKRRLSGASEKFPDPLQNMKFVTRLAHLNAYLLMHPKRTTKVRTIRQVSVTAKQEVFLSTAITTTLKSSLTPQCGPHKNWFRVCVCVWGESKILNVRGEARYSVLIPRPTETELSNILKKYT